MESFKCKFCFKSFFNGRALDVHMRSHMPTFHKFNEEEERPSQLNDETESDFCSSPEGPEDDRKFTFFDGESETESSRNINNLTRKRSKRTRKLESFKKVKTSQLEAESEPELEPPHSSASDTTTEEDLAFCLMMLSRDKWKKNNTEEESSKVKSKGRYKCETCGKVFKSYQALGGHRASHKKNKVSNKTEFDNVVAVVTTPEKKIHECPICKRVFASGQALGGHKRSHGIGNLSVNHQIESVNQRMIDLNLPAPTEEDNVSIVFQ